MVEPSPDAGKPWWLTLHPVLVNTTGFIYGFIFGGVTGYFGNWLWYRFGPLRKKPHLQFTSEDGVTSFSGVMTPENKEEVIKSLKASCRRFATGKPTVLQAPVDESATSDA